MSSPYLPGYTSTLKTLSDQCLYWNNTLKFNWLSYFHNSFLVNLTAHPGDPATQTNPTPPPPSWVVTGQLTSDPSMANDQDVLEAIYSMSVAQTGPAVTSVPPFTQPVIIAQSWFHAG